VLWNCCGLMNVSYADEVHQCGQDLVKEFELEVRVREFVQDESCMNLNACELV